MARRPLPDLSRFELQCLRLLWEEEPATVRRIHARLADAPSYSTVRKIFERLEDKGAVERAGRDGAAWLYRPVVPRTAMIRKEIREFLDSVFDGAAEPLVAHLAEMEAVTLDDLRQVEEILSERDAGDDHPPDDRPGDDEAPPVDLAAAGAGAGDPAGEDAGAGEPAGDDEPREEG